MSTFDFILETESCHANEYGHELAVVGFTLIQRVKQNIRKNAPQNV
jgi:hypothetical protein